MMADHASNTEAMANNKQTIRSPQKSPCVKYAFESKIQALPRSKIAMESKGRTIRTPVLRESGAAMTTTETKSPPDDEGKDPWDERTAALQQIASKPAAHAQTSPTEVESRFAVQPLLDALPSIAPTPLSSSVRRHQFPLQQPFVFTSVPKPATKSRLPSTSSSSPFHQSKTLSTTSARSIVDNIINKTSTQLQTWNKTFGLKPSQFRLRLSKPVFWKRIEDLVEQLRFVADFLGPDILARGWTVGMLWNREEARRILEELGGTWEMLRILGTGYAGLKFKDEVGREVWRIEKTFKRFLQWRTTVKGGVGKDKGGGVGGASPGAVVMSEKSQRLARDMAVRAAAQAESDDAVNSCGNDSSFSEAPGGKDVGITTAQKEAPTCGVVEAAMDESADNSGKPGALPEVVVEYDSSSDSDDGGVQLG